MVFGLRYVGFQCGAVEDNFFSNLRILKLIMVM